MESGHIPCNLYNDLSKVVDTLSHDILLNKLKYNGFVGTELKSLTSYMLNRKQYVKYKSYQSDIVDISTGVPQGSILGPLLFSIHLNDLVCSSDMLNFLMYADDTTIYFNLKDFDQRRIESEINNKLERVNIWLKLNKLSLNIKKTKLMIFGSKQKKIKEIYNSIDYVHIERVHTLDFLGIMLDESLTWTDHTNMVANKISRVTGVLYRLKSVFPKEILLTLYTIHLLCHI